MRPNSYQVATGDRGKLEWLKLSLARVVREKGKVETKVIRLLVEDWKEFSRKENIFFERFIFLTAMWTVVGSEPQ